MDATEGARLRVYLDQFYPRSKGGIEKLADDAGLRRGTMYAWFSGKGQPNLDSLRALAGALGVTRATIVAAIDGEDLNAARRAAVAEEVDSALGPIRSLMRDAGLIPADTTPAEEPRGVPQSSGRAA